MFVIGQEVHLKTDPTRVGVIVGQPRKTGAIVRFQVRFNDGTQSYPGQMLVAIENEGLSDDPVDILGRGISKGVEHLRGALTHSRLSGKLANLVYSMDTTNTEFYPYQFKPVLNFLDSPSKGLLIADEVGLGKTIEAGLVWSELKAREEARRLVIVCPAMLKPKWIKELKDRFGETARDCSANELVTLINDYDAGLIQNFTAVVSMQGLRPPRGWDEENSESNSGASKLARLLDKNAYERNLFDLVVIDEAHYLRNSSSQTAKLGRLLRPVTDGLVLLSATPIQTKTDDLFELMSLIDESSFDNVESFKAILNANQPIVELRQKILTSTLTTPEFVEYLTEAQQHYIFRQNQQIAELIKNPPSGSDLSRSEVRARLAFQLDGINLLSRGFTRTRKRDVTEWRVVREPRAISAQMTQMERHVYDLVTSKVRRYAIENDISEGLLQTIPQRQISSSIPAALRSWLKKGDLWQDSDAFNQEIYESGVRDEVSSAAEKKGIGPLLTQLIAAAKELHVSLPDLYEQDSKFNSLSRQMLDYWKMYPDSKIVLFSYYRETLNYLEERFQKIGVKTVKLVGGVSPDEKQSAIDWFKTPDGPQLMLSSEVASEGVDLQFSSLLINYDLPWNPMRVEQRIGRIDRIGQSADRILIWNLLYEDTIDERIFNRLAFRLQASASAIGDMEAVLGERIQDLTRELLFHDLTPDQEEQRIIQTQQAIANLERQNRELEDNAAFLVAHGDTILQKVKAAKELGRFIKGEDLFYYVLDFLQVEYPGCEIQIDHTETLSGTIRLTTAAADAYANYLKNNPRQIRSRITTANQGPIKCRFHNKAIEIPGTEVIDQNHSLVRFVANEIQQGKAPRFPVITADVSRSELDLPPSDYAFIIRRWTFTGAKTQEVLVMRAVDIETGKALAEEEAEKLINITSVVGRNMVGGAGQLDLTQTVEQLEHLRNELDTEGYDYHQLAKIQNNDFINQQIVSFEEFINSKIKEIEYVIKKLREENKLKVIPANEGRIRKNRELLKIKKDQLTAQRNFSFDPRDICMGVIRVS